MKRLLAAVTVLWVAMGGAFAATNTWQGANTTNGTSSQVFVDDPARWSLGWVPAAGDTATFNYSGSNVADLAIAGTNQFAPSVLVFNGNVNPTAYGNNKLLLLDKSLALSNVVLSIYPGSLDVGRNAQRLRIGTLSTTGAPTVLTFPGNGEVLNITNAEWVSIALGTNRPGRSAVVDFQGTNLTFSRGRPQLIGSVNWPTDTMMGGRNLDDAAGSSNNAVTFSADNATISLAGQGLRGATLGLGYHGLQVCTGQTWSADATAYVKLFHRLGAGGSGPDIVQCLNGSRLDNLGALNVRVEQNTATVSTKATGMRLVGGTYGSLYLTRGYTYYTLYNAYVVLKGPVTLQGLAVRAPEVVGSVTNPAAVTDASLVLETGAGGYVTPWILDTDGQALSLSNGLRITDAFVPISAVLPGAWLGATGSTVTVGGNIVVHSDNIGPWAATNAVLKGVSRSFGIVGDANTVLNLKGSYSNDCASMSGNGLSLSTINLMGGTNWRTFEVGDARTNASYRTTYSFAVRTFNVGDGTTPGRVRLVNNFLNDNPIVQSNATDLAGEKLTVSNLNIKAGSTLDCSAQPVEIWGALTIAADATLNLNTGVKVEVPVVCTNFYAIGNQSTSWDAYKGRVIDSANAIATFLPVYVAGDNKTYWRLLPYRGTVFSLR